MLQGQAMKNAVICQSLAMKVPVQFQARNVGQVVYRVLME